MDNVRSQSVSIFIETSLGDKKPVGNFCGIIHTPPLDWTALPAGKRA
jgi:hypothetical protein